MDTVKNVKTNAKKLNSVMHYLPFSFFAFETLNDISEGKSPISANYALHITLVINW
jgi:hypothetical protein